MPSLRAAVTLGATRVLVVLVGAAAVMIIGTWPPPVAEAVWRLSSNELVNLLARWDTYYYYAIATDGYQWDPAVFSHQNVVFFPLYPVMMRVVGAALGGRPMIAALVISWVAFGTAMVVLSRLVRLEMGGMYVWPVLLLVSTFPYAFFFSVAYTESLFLLVSVSAFYFMRRGRWGPAACAAVLTGLTRPNGFWLAGPLAWIALSEGYEHTADDRSHRVRRAWAALGVACLPVVGTAIYSIFLWVRFSDALAWMHGQAAWGVPLLGRHSAPDPVNLPGIPRIKVTEVIAWMGNIAAFGAAAYAINPVWRRLGAPYGLWIAVNIFPPVATHLFISLGRFVSVLFPVFFWVALHISPSRLRQIAAAFFIAQLIFATWFFLWRPVV
jgi:hypothetical protein